MKFQTQHYQKSLIRWLSAHSSGWDSILKNYSLHLSSHIWKMIFVNIADIALESVYIFSKDEPRWQKVKYQINLILSKEHYFWHKRKKQEIFWNIFSFLHPVIFSWGISAVQNQFTSIIHLKSLLIHFFFERHKLFFHTAFRHFD